MGILMPASRPQLVHTLARFGLGLGIVSIVVQYIVFQPLFRQMGLGPVSSAFGMLMYVTILTNLMMVAAYWSASSRSTSRISAFFNRTGVRTAIAAHIALVAIVYVTAIRGEIALTPPMLVTDALLHYLAPIVYLGWWWLLPGKQSLHYTNIPMWLAWPAIYLAFIMTAGFFTGGFIYSILDVNKLGSMIVAINIALVFGLLAAISAGLVFVARTQATK